MVGGQPGHEQRAVLGGLDAHLRCAKQPAQGILVGAADPDPGGRGGGRDELRDAGVGDQPAPPDDDRAGGGLGDLAHQVRGDEDRLALGGQVGQQAADPPACSPLWAAPSPRAGSSTPPRPACRSLSSAPPPPGGSASTGCSPGSGSGWAGNGSRWPASSARRSWHQRSTPPCLSASRPPRPTSASTGTPAPSMSAPRPARSPPCRLCSAPPPTQKHPTTYRSAGRRTRSSPRQTRKAPSTRCSSASAPSPSLLAGLESPTS